MAYAITSFVDQLAGFIPTKTVTHADKTASWNSDLGAAAFRSFRASVYLKSFTAPDGNTTASASTTFSLEVSNSSNFDAANADVFRVDAYVIPHPAFTTAVKHSFILEGTVPLVAGYQYMQVRVTAGTNGAVNCDAIFEAA